MKNVINKKATGEKIFSIAAEKGITIAELAKMLHISYQAASKWKQGLCLPQIGFLFTIATILDVKVDDLIVVNDEKLWKKG